MLIFPCNSSLQQAQPLVFLDGEVFIKTRRGGGAGSLVTALGVAHRLRRFCSIRNLLEHLRRFNGPGVRHLLEAEFSRRSAAECMDALRYVVDYLAPNFCERDWNEAYQETGPSCRALPPPDMATELAIRADLIPFPEFPSPSLWLFGRVWLLHAAPVAAAHLHVRCHNDDVLGLTGEYTLAGTLVSRWNEAVHNFVCAAAGELADKARSLGNDRALRRAKEEVAQNGFWQCGDLLFLPGSPPRLGYVLPPHYNRVLGRESSRDLALTAPLILPPQISFPSVYQRSSDSRWEHFQPPNGLCLGSGPPGNRPTNPGLALAAYLRWAALRIAANKKFHASDD